MIFSTSLLLKGRFRARLPNRLMALQVFPGFSCIFSSYSRPRHSLSESLNLWVANNRVLSSPSNSRCKSRGTSFIFSIFLCRLSISSLASLTAAEYWKQRVATVAEILITAMTLPAAERPSITRDLANELRRASKLAQHNQECVQVQRCSHESQSILSSIRLADDGRRAASVGGNTFGRGRLVL